MSADDQTRAHETRLNDVDTRVGKLETWQRLFEQSMHSEHSRLHDRIESLSTTVDAGFARIEAKIDAGDTKFEFHSRQEGSDRRRTNALLATTLIAVLLSVGGASLVYMYDHITTDQVTSTRQLPR